MPGNPFYQSPFWKALRKQRLQMDGHRCAVAGCTRRATFADHIVTRPYTAAPCALDCIGNLRSLCPTHDAQAKEFRRTRGSFKVIGCDSEGWPLDPHRR